MINKFIILVIIIANLCLAVTITGKVDDETNAQLLVGANVYLEDTQFGGSTNIDGQYIIMDVPKNGKYTVIVKYLGYKKYTKEINVLNQESMTLDIILKPTNIKIKGEEIIGRAKAIKDKITNSPATKELISSERIQVEASTNLGSYLKGLKGVDYTASGMDSSSISVRGFSGRFWCCQLS